MSVWSRASTWVASAHKQLGSNHARFIGVGQLVVDAALLRLECALSDRDHAASRRAAGCGSTSWSSRRSWRSRRSS